jgi:hypothetical protein
VIFAVTVTIWAAAEVSINFGEKSKLVMAGGVVSEGDDIIVKLSVKPRPVRVEVFSVV